LDLFCTPMRRMDLPGRLTSWPQSKTSWRPLCFPGRWWLLSFSTLAAAHLKGTRHPRWVVKV